MNKNMDLMTRQKLTLFKKMMSVLFKQSVNINNLPDFGSVSESETTETLVFTLAFDSTGPHTCTMDSYLPTRTEGNPFLVKPTPSSGKCFVICIYSFICTSICVQNRASFRDIT